MGLAGLPGSPRAESIHVGDPRIAEILVGTAPNRGAPAAARTPAQPAPASPDFGARVAAAGVKVHPLVSLMPTARPRPRPRLALVSNDLLSTYQVALSGAIERAALARGFDVVAVMGREIAHEDPAERAQNVVYGWVSPDVVDGAIVLTGTPANFCGKDGLRRL